MAKKKVNHIITIVFIIASVLLIFIEFTLQFTADKESSFNNKKMLLQEEESVDTTGQNEEEIQLPIDFME